MLPQNGPNLELARATLRTLASNPRAPRVIEVLRTLRSEILLALASGYPPGRIYRSLRSAGYDFTHAPFYAAWRIFSEENRLPTRTIIPRGRLGTPLVSPLATQHAGKMRSMDLQRPPPGSALQAVMRPNVTELLLGGVGMQNAPAQAP